MLELVLIGEITSKLAGTIHCKIFSPLMFICKQYVRKRGDNGLPSVLKCVREAESIIIEQQLNHEYLGIIGDPEFVKLSLKFVYGEECVPLAENRVAGVQTLSGTGGLRVFGEFLKKGDHKHIYVPNPTWGNHIPIFQHAGLEVRKYRYYSEGSNLEFDNMVKDIAEMPEGSTILLHACAHNPTGMDPSREQWIQISDIVKKKKLIPFFDCAYQGFASGNAPQDAFAIRMFVEDGHTLATVQSFSKNFGLYGQRVGALSVIGNNPDEAQKILSQLKATIRPMYSNPPTHGAQIVKTTLSYNVKKWPIESMPCDLNLDLRWRKENQVAHGNIFRTKLACSLTVV